MHWGLGAIGHQQAAPGIYRGIACYNGDTPQTGEDDRPMQRPTPKLQWEGTGLTAHCLSYPRSFWQTVSRPSHCGVRFAQVEERETPYIRVTQQAESVVGSGGRRLKPFLIWEACKWKIKRSPLSALMFPKGKAPLLFADQAAKWY